MNYLAVAAALTGLLTTAADAQSAACRAEETQERAQVECKKKAAPKVQSRDVSPMTPADKEILNQAHTRTLLENLEGQARRLR